MVESSHSKFTTHLLFNCHGRKPMAMGGEIIGLSFLRSILSLANSILLASSNGKHRFKLRLTDDF